ncbi:unnamed protein product [Acanthosepion pharaonis]|uniref:Uncharacterized protein n=1 Tax=Acanthosepion pharaonis TaxID=158019 RepID=A0A812CCX3_ACAPH|nr:unnamed protein product [Sepia pharaonis]
MLVRRPLPKRITGVRLRQTKALGNRRLGNFAEHCRGRRRKRLRPSTDSTHLPSEGGRQAGALRRSVSLCAGTRPLATGERCSNTVHARRRRPTTAEPGGSRPATANDAKEGSKQARHSTELARTYLPRRITGVRHGKRRRRTRRDRRRPSFDDDDDTQAFVRRFDGLITHSHASESHYGRPAMANEGRPSRNRSALLRASGPTSTAERRTTRVRLRQTTKAFDGLDALTFRGREAGRQAHYGVPSLAAPVLAHSPPANAVRVTTFAFLRKSRASQCAECAERSATTRQAQSKRSITFSNLGFLATDTVHARRRRRRRPTTAEAGGARPVTANDAKEARKQARPSTELALTYLPRRITGVRRRQTKEGFYPRPVDHVAPLRGSGPFQRENRVVPRGGRIESVEGLVSIDRSVVAALLSTTPRACSQVVYERSLVSRSTGGSKFDGDGNIPPVADVKSGGPFADAAACETTTAKVANAHGDDERHRRGPRRPRPPLSTTTPAMAGSSGTKRDAFPVIARRQRGAAARSSEHANRCSDPAVPLVLDGIAVATADVTYVPIETSLRTLGRHKPVIPVVTFLTPLGGTELSARKGSMGHAFAVRIRTENRDRASFLPFALREVFVLADLALGHLRYRLTDVPPQSNSPLGTQEGRRATCPLFHRVSEEMTKVAVFQVRRHQTTPVAAKAGKTGTNETPAHRGGGGPRPTEKKNESGEAESERRLRREARTAHRPPPQTPRQSANGANATAPYPSLRTGTARPTDPEPILLPKGRRKSTGRRPSRGALQVPFPFLRTSRFHGHGPLRRRENSSGALGDVSGLACVTAVSPEERRDATDTAASSAATTGHFPSPGSGILTRFPFDGRLAARRSRLLFEYLLLPPRSAPAVGSTQARALGFRAHRGALLLVAASVRRAHRFCFSASAPRRDGPASVRRSSAIHFRGRGFRLPWPPSCCLYRPTPFQGSHGRRVRHLAGRLVHPAAPVLDDQKWPVASSFVSAAVETTKAAEKQDANVFRRVRPEFHPFSEFGKGRGTERDGREKGKTFDGTKMESVDRTPAAREGGGTETRRLDWSFDTTPGSDDRFARQRRFGLPPEFFWLHRDRAWIAVFRDGAGGLRQSRGPESYGRTVKRRPTALG